MATEMTMVMVLVMAMMMVMVLVIWWRHYGGDDGIDDVGGDSHNEGNGGVIVMVLSMVMITVLATVMVLTKKVLAITVPL